MSERAEGRISSSSYSVGVRRYVSVWLCLCEGGRWAGAERLVANMSVGVNVVSYIMLRSVARGSMNARVP